MLTVLRRWAEGLGGADLRMVLQAMLVDMVRLGQLYQEQLPGVSCAGQTIESITSVTCVWLCRAIWQRCQLYRAMATADMVRGPLRRP